MFPAIALAWKLGGFRGVLKMIPKPVWIALAVAIALGGAYWYHGHRVRAFEKSTRADEHAKVDAQWKAAFDKMHQAAIKWKQNYETASGKLATARRNQHEETLRTDAARAGGLLNNGPGAARCGQVNNSSLSTSASGRNAGSGPVNANVDRVPSEGGTALAAVSFPDLVLFGRICDANRSEVVTWRGHDSEQRALRNGMLSAPENK